MIFWIKKIVRKSAKALSDTFGDSSYNLFYIKIDFLI